MSMERESLPRGAEELDIEQVKWRVLKLREILGITEAGPYMYTAKKMPKETVISYSQITECLLKHTKGPIYVHYHGGEIVKVSWWAFKEFWGEGHYYCTIFDESFSWFAFTDDNSEEHDRAILAETSGEI
ncbi:hypothetical protein [Thalassomonas haliotis]|uniref:Uncharacterized protein n=1 Tax=Thalassomonas haliotis TaxID=485448 RepID=A0ABY7VAJ4_9GAMM|nr:hypothetical protein [Thalassomonas haliotis]WDE10640.1 hypothetical protein H3N35_20630 [Thalassomonas haliotis]